ncbi:putative C-type lectin domain family 20 member A [Carassius auratus]|uniref:C-type lectin domain family 20 member A n=1 Tax=Carassius auratus TaxID=7957 RepID=A0A6P6PMV8_CARAU|nr:putative C-type lectin domain family 20 member A [Carassius auratus]
MTWRNAQNYCRTHHTDLVTIQSNEDWTRMREDTDSFPGFTWIGLHNDINSWRWSYNEESLVFKNWASGQPDNYYGKEQCAGKSYNGGWQDKGCTDLNYFICYDGSANATEKMVLSKTSKTWIDAQEYCRHHYTDLATIRSPEDNDKINTLQSSLQAFVWIGLYRDSWKWSDQTNFTSSTQLTTQKFGQRTFDCVGAYINSGSLESWSCSLVYYFCCNTVKRKKQMIRVQVKAAENVDEDKLKALVLNQLKQTLSDEDITMTWRTQPNGKVWTVRKRSEANTTLVCPSFP